jgi:6-phosphogluconolactonase
VANQKFAQLIPQAWSELLIQKGHWRNSGMHLRRWSASGAASIRVAIARCAECMMFNAFPYDVEVFPSQPAMVETVAAEIAAALAFGLEGRARALFVATGGGTAPAIYDHLRTADLEWSRLDVTLSDERLVPADHPGSNAKLLRDTLLQGPAARAHLHLLDSDTAITGLSFPADVTLLGMGADLHIASIFPAGAGMSEARLSRKRLIVTEPDPLPPAAPFARRTLTLSALCESRKIILAFTGAQKKDALEKAARAGSEAPVFLLAALAGPKLVWRWAP